MNLFESEMLNKLYFEPFVNQRILAETTGCSVGAVNKALRQLTEAGYLDGQMQLTQKGRQEVRGKMPKSAIILAAGFGMRMVPINTSTPKALLEVNGEPLIERTIRQLHEAGVTNITVVVGFMKEQFEYLIDEYGVDSVCLLELVVGLEDEFGIVIEDGDFSVKNFESVDAIAEFVSQRLA